MADFCIICVCWVLKHNVTIADSAKQLKASFVFYCIFSLDPSKRTHELPWVSGLQTLKWEDVSLTTWGLIIAGLGGTVPQTIAEKLCLN